MPISTMLEASTTVTKLKSADFTATQLGIQLAADGSTVGTNPITIRGYAGTSGLAEDCSQSQQPTQTAQAG